MFLNVLYRTISGRIIALLLHGKTSLALSYISTLIFSTLRMNLNSFLLRINGKKKGLSKYPSSSSPLIQYHKWKNHLYMRLHEWKDYQSCSSTLSVAIVTRYRLIMQLMHAATASHPPGSSLAPCCVAPVQTHVHMRCLRKIG